MSAPLQTPTNSPVINGSSGLVLPLFSPDEQRRVELFLQLYNQATPIIKYHMLNQLCYLNVKNFTLQNKLTPPSYKDILMNTTPMNPEVVVASEVLKSPSRSIKLLKKPPSHTKKEGKITQSADQEVSNFNQTMVDSGY